MWLRVLIAVSITTHVLSQHAHATQKLQQGGEGFEWGWQLTAFDTPAPIDQYYVQPVQQFQYTANVGVFQNGDHLVGGNLPASVDYNDAIPVQIYQNPSLSNNTLTAQSDFDQEKSDILLLKQQFSPPQLQTLQSDLSGHFIPYTNLKHNVYRPNTSSTQSGYKIETQHPTPNHKLIKVTQGNDRANDILNPKPPQEVRTELNREMITPVVQVFKNYNCSDDDAVNTPKEYNNNMQKSTQFSADTPTYNEHNINEHFGSKNLQKRPLSYKNEPDFKIEKPRGNTDNEAYYYYSSETIPAPSLTSTNYKVDEGISRLVASTQDLVSNDDLLRINNSAEKQVSDINDYHLKARPRYNLRSEETRYNQKPRNQITVKAKIRNIENRPIQHPGYNDATDSILQSNYESNKFSSPIVVQESNNGDYRETVINTLVSTMSPYIENGYEIVSIKQDSEKNNINRVPQYFNDETVHITPRPLGQRYLAPITVALRLINSNHTEVLNSIDDYETSDTELIEDTVKSPSKERTVVEVHESIPLDITHINDVEVHEYLEEGRSNSSPFDVARTLYNTYMEVLQSSKKNERNINEVLSKYNKTSNSDADANYDDNESNNNDQDAKDKLESSENVQSAVLVKLSGKEFNNERYRSDYYYNNRNAINGKAIQPIIIEKEVPITQYVDRYIEQKMPYPEPVEVAKHGSIYSPIPVPVPHEKVVEKPVEVTKYIDKPYAVHVPQPYPVSINIPYPVEQKVYVDRAVHTPYPVEKLVEKQVVHTVPVPTSIAVTVEKPVLLPFPVEKPVEKIIHKEVPVPYPVPVEKKVLYPVPYERKVRVPYPVEKRVPVPVEKIIEKQVRVPVPIPVHIVTHYPVDRIVEKKVPYLLPVDRIVEKNVPVNIPYPVEKVVEKVVEKPVVVTKYVDNSNPVETKFIYHVNNPYTARQSDSFTYHPQYPQYQNQPKPHASPDIQNKQQHDQSQQGYLDQFYQYLTENQQQNSIPVQKTHWDNLYASSFKYVNVTPKDNKETKKDPSISYSTYSTNNQNYYGPPPEQSYDTLWENNDYLTETKFKRTDRTPKLTNLRIEYGGFKPPLIPSIEVDLDGRPLKKRSKT